MSEREEVDRLVEAALEDERRSDDDPGFLTISYDIPLDVGLLRLKMARTALERIQHRI